MKRAFALLLAVLWVLQGCSWIKSWGDDDDEPGAPNPLVEFEPTLATQKVWSAKIGAGVGREDPRLRLAHDQGTLFAADHKGLLVSLDATNGRKRWEVKTKLPFTGGPGVSTEAVYMGTENGEVHAFSKRDGTLLWTAQLSSEILATPVAADGILVMRCIDGRVFGLDESSGTRLWIYDHAVPLLTLRGNSRPLIRAGLIFLGYDGGEVVALKLNDGSLVWEQTVVAAEGRSELERLADIDGEMVYVAADLLVSSYKNRLVSLAADSGRLLWFKDIGSASGVVVDRINLAVSDRVDHVWLLDRRNGATIWKQDQLENRALTRPAIQGSFVVVGDFEGYLHWIDIGGGGFAAREKVGGDGFAAPPMVIGSTLFVLTRQGELAAFSAGGSS